MHSLKKELVNLIGTGRPKEILIERSHGGPLDEIGLKFQITRERARQIEAKPKKNIREWLLKRKEEILELLSDDGVLINKKKANEFFGKENFEILCYCVHEKRKKERMDGWFCMPEIGTIGYSEELKFPTMFYDMVEKSSKMEYSVEDICDNCQKNGFPFVDKEFMEEFVSETEYRNYGGYLFPHKITIGKAIYMATKGKYKDGINISDDVQMSEFVKHLNEVYGQNVKAGRALNTRIQSTLVMYSRGVYVNPDNIGECEILNKQIMDTVKDSNAILSYQQLFQMLDPVLMKNAGVETPGNLAGYLHSHEKELRLMVNRYYIEPMKEEGEMENSKEFFQQMVDYLNEKKRAVCVEEVLRDLNGWDILYPKYAMFYFPQIVQWDSKAYLSLDIFDFDKESCDSIRKVVTKCLDNNIGYVNAFVVYSIIKKEYPEIIRKFQIKTETHMFYIIKHAYYLNGWSDTSFRKPHIYKTSNSECGKLSTEKLIEKIAGSMDIVSREALSEELLKYYGKKNNGLFLAIQKGIRKFTRINKDEYTMQQNIFLKEEDKNQIRKFVLSKIEKDGYLIPVACEDEYSQIPAPRFKTGRGKVLPWNSWLFLSVVESLGLPVKILNRRNNASQNAMIIVPENSKIETREDLITWVIREKLKTDSCCDDMYDYLYERMLISKSVTQQEVMQMVEGAKEKIG